MAIIVFVCIVKTSLQKGSVLKHGYLPSGISDISWVCWSIYGFSGREEQNFKYSGCLYWRVEIFKIATDSKSSSISTI